MFIGLFDINNIQEVLDNRKKIMQFAYHGGLLHDVGKMFIFETIMTYGRDLSPEERQLLQLHTNLGSKLLQMNHSTREYSDLALGHHKYYDNIHGYPESFDYQKVANPIMIYILTIADCLDAATDIVGRNYKKGISIEQYIEELNREKAGRYSPELVDLFNDKKVVDIISYHLINERQENYKRAYELLIA